MGSVIFRAKKMEDGENMAKVLIVYHTLSGNTEKMAQAFAEGAKSVQGTEVLLKKALDATLEDLLGCDAIAFGSADYFSYIAGALKDFFDRTYYPSQGKVTGKPYAAFATGGRGGGPALSALDRLCNSFKFEKAVGGVAVERSPSPESLAKCKEAGKKLAIAASKH
jgi:multimeric flavodoxin WrbA